MHTSIPQVLITESGVVEVHLLDSVESYSSLSLIEVGLLVLHILARSRSNQKAVCCIAEDIVGTCQTIAMLTDSEGDQVIRLLDIAQCDTSLLTT